jgi:SAM-dependent methyltransferase
MTENINHSYDGLFYDLFIAPHQDQVFAQAKEILAERSMVLDVGCGTGRLASQLLDKCERIVIIDPSERNIDIARRKLAGVPPEKLLIKHSDALDFIMRTDWHFDFAIVSYVLHEIKEEERDVLLWGLSGVADKIIIVDYLVPQPRNYCRLLNELVEYGAGPEHYGNFKSFVKGNGITGLLEKVPLKVVSQVRNKPCSSHTVVLEGKTGHNRDPIAPRPVRNNTRTEVEQRRSDPRQTVRIRLCF